MQPWLMAGHFIGILAWAGGLIALSRLLASHQRAAVAPEAAQTLIRVERAIYRRLAAPGAFLTIFTGVALIHRSPALLKHPAMLGKLALLALLLGLDHGCMRGPRRLARRADGGPGYGIMHALVLGTLAAIAVLVTVRPGGGG